MIEFDLLAPKSSFIFLFKELTLKTFVFVLSTLNKPALVPSQIASL